MILMQVQSLMGSKIKGAEWQVKNLDGIFKGNEMSIPKDTNDEKLVKWVSRGINGISVDKIEEKKFVITFDTYITTISHLLNPLEKDFDSICILEAINRDVDDLIRYMFSPEESNPAFLRLLEKFKI